jgi:O-antigen/teichoic acid export membrane protein
MLSGVGAGGYAQLVTIALQLVTVPLFLSQWSLTEYGYWLIVSAAQTYFALSEFGVTSAIGSRMTVLVARPAARGANQAFHAATLFIASVCLAMLLLSPGAWALFSTFGVPDDYALASVILVACVAVSQLGGLAFAVYQSTNRNHLGLASTANIRIAELAGALLGLFATGSPVFVALGMLGARSLATALVLLNALRRQSIFSLRLGRWKIVRLYLGRSSSNFLTSLASSLSLQGLTLVVGGFYGAADAAIFSTYRTAGRIVVQATAILSHAAWPEFGILHGSGDRVGLRALYRRTQMQSLTVSLAASVGFVLCIPLVLQVWTRGEVPMNQSLAIAIGVYALAASLWHVPRVLLTSVGKNRGVAVVALLSSTILIGVGVAIGAIGVPLTGQAWAMACTEVIIGTIVVYLAARWLRSGQ